jgi:uncharacterized RDD family membrane protein YckC
MQDQQPLNPEEKLTPPTHSSTANQSGDGVVGTTHDGVDQPVAMTQGSSEISYARIRDRVLARVLDGLIILGGAILVAAAAGIVIFKGADNPDVEGMVFLAVLSGFIVALIGIVVAGFIFAVYEVVALKRSGATLGKRARNLRVVDASTGGPLTWGQSISRSTLFWAVGAISNLVPYLGSAVLAAHYGLGLWRRDGRHLADLGAKTTVVTLRPERVANPGNGRKIAAVAVATVVFTLGFAPEPAGVVDDSSPAVTELSEVSAGEQIMIVSARVLELAKASSPAASADAELDTAIDAAFPGQVEDFGYWSYQAGENELSVTIDGETEFRYLCREGVVTEPCAEFASASGDMSFLSFGSD